MEKIFVLGVGCQKGGTTWLYKQLIKSEAVNFGYTKEYHVFDTIYTPYLFNKRSTDKLSNFLEINADIFEAKDHVNASFTHEELSEATVRKVAMHYSSVYELVGSRFPIKNFWDSSLKIIDQ